MNQDPVVINYASANTPGRDSSVLYRWAIGLAIFPLIGGIAIFLLYLITRFDNLMELGFIWLGVGILFVTASSIVALIHVAKDWNSGLRSKGRIFLRLLAILGLIASNFLAAALIIFCVVHTR